MVEINAVYEGNLRCKATHGPSGAELLTDAPVDNHGKGESYSPTDLLATALGTCMMTIMGIYANGRELDITGTKVKVFKEMTPEAPRRIAKLTTEITVPLPSDSDHIASLERAALSCPVHLSLHPEIEKPITWNWVG